MRTSWIFFSILRMDIGLLRYVIILLKQTSWSILQTFAFLFPLKNLETIKLFHNYLETTCIVQQIDSSISSFFAKFNILFFLILRTIVKSSVKTIKFPWYKLSLFYSKLHCITSIKYVFVGKYYNYSKYNVKPFTIA